MSVGKCASAEKEVRSIAACIESLEWPMSKAEGAPDNVKGARGACRSTRHKRDLLASKTAKPVELFIHGAELLAPLVDAVSFVDD